MKKYLFLMGLVSVVGQQAYAADALVQIQNQWSVCQYQVEKDAKEGCLETLSKEASQQSLQNKSRVDLLIWSAIVKSSWAGAKGGLDALSLVKEAKGELEQALARDPKSLNGSAYTSLGTLYYQVPGWPIGFGDNKQAEQLLKQALVINPDGIDPNFFYGDFLLEQGRKKEAKTYLTKALNAPERIGRELADKGRKQEIQDRLSEL